MNESPCSNAFVTCIIINLYQIKLDIRNCTFVALQIKFANQNYILKTTYLHLYTDIIRRACKSISPHKSIHGECIVWADRLVLYDKLFCILSYTQGILLCTSTPYTPNCYAARGQLKDIIPGGLSLMLVVTCPGFL